MFNDYDWEVIKQKGSGVHWRNPGDIVVTKKTMYTERSHPKAFVSIKHTKGKSKSINIDDIKEIKTIANKHANGDWLLVIWLNNKPYVVTDLEDYLYYRSDYV